MKRIRQKEFAALVGVTEGYISNLLRGKKHASKDVATAIASTMGNCTPDLWVFGSSKGRKKAFTEYQKKG